MNMYSPKRGSMLVSFAVVLLALGPAEVHAFGDVADQMCDHPDRFIEGKPASYTEMNPRSPDYGKSGVIGQPCNDGTMASGYCTTIVKAGQGTGCLATKCGGTECKQPKPGEQPQPSPSQQQPPGGGDQQGQQDQGKGGQPPQMPQGGGGGGGDKPPQQQPQQSTAENCAFSGAFNIPCQKPVSSELGTGHQSPVDVRQLLSEPGGSVSDTEASKATAPEAQSDIYHRVSDGISGLWQRLSGSAPPGDESSDPGAGDVGATSAANATFGAPPAYSDSFTLEEKSSWSQRVVTWFQNLFR